jgi:transmembrane sensor
MLMQPHVTRLSYLFHRYVDRTIAVEERKEFMDLIRQEHHSEELNTLIDVAMKSNSADMDISSLRADELFELIMRTTAQEGQAKIISIKKPRFRWMAAASVAILIGAGCWFLFFNTPKEKVIAAAVKPKAPVIISPAGTKATLTLADGSVITLDNADNGTLAKQGNTQIIKMKDGSLTYKAAGAPGQDVSINTINTPKGGHYQVILPDGSLVWLNAASSLTFPTAFTGSSREVKLSGEAYFEISANKKMPFLVNVQQSVITVLGTNFNVNGYMDEDHINTTLLEGAVKFTNNSHDQRLRPGQQVLFRPADGSMQVQEADISQVMSWKNGFFEFENMDIKGIMRQISRWYDVDIIYGGNIADDLKLSGSISRKLSLQELQRLIEPNGVYFKIDGRKIFVGH